LAVLAEQAAPQDWVVVHDAARPCLQGEDLRRLMDCLRPDQVGGVLAVPLVDTLKRADEHGRVAETLPRTNLWRALTPQMFRFGILERALALAESRDVAVTDESQAVELLGLKPQLIRGEADNLKVTTPADLEQAARILAARGAR
jgi:2-C-methyl-D-erythritol 4-phosphate cytidylyltransferase